MQVNEWLGRPEQGGWWGQRESLGTLTRAPQNLELVLFLLHRFVFEYSLWQANTESGPTPSQESQQAAVSSAPKSNPVWPPYNSVDAVLRILFCQDHLPLPVLVRAELLRLFIANKANRSLPRYFLGPTKVTWASWCLVIVRYETTKSLIETQRDNYLEMNPLFQPHNWVCVREMVAYNSV